MDQVTLVEEAFKRFQVIWSASADHIYQQSWITTAILTNALDFISQIGSI